MFQMHKNFLQLFQESKYPHAYYLNDNHHIRYDTTSGFKYLICKNSFSRWIFKILLHKNRDRVAVFCLRTVNDKQFLLLMKVSILSDDNGALNSNGKWWLRRSNKWIYWACQILYNKHRTQYDNMYSHCVGIWLQNFQVSYKWNEKLFKFT